MGHLPPNAKGKFEMLFSKAAAALLVIAITSQARASSQPNGLTVEQPTFDQVMLILRGVANSENPLGQLDDDSALEYARRWLGMLAAYHILGGSHDRMEILTAAFAMRNPGGVVKRTGARSETKRWPAAAGVLPGEPERRLESKDSGD
jgi:hypothetical protein